MAGEGSLAGATLTGYRAGETAARDALNEREPRPDEEQVRYIEKNIKAPLCRKSAVDPIDLEEAIRSINTDYIGYYKSEGMMQKGLELILKLKSAHLPILGARNPHGLMRCMEVKNLIDVSEMHVRASLMRRETRFSRMGMMHHVRLDYPEMDPLWGKWIVLRREDEEMTLSTREIPKIKESVKREIEDEISRRRY